MNVTSATSLSTAWTALPQIDPTAVAETPPEPEPDPAPFPADPNGGVIVSPPFPGPELARADGMADPNAAGSAAAGSDMGTIPSGPNDFYGAIRG